MIVDNNFKFKVNISNDFYTSKEEAKACLSFKSAKALGRNKMAFRETEVSVDEFLNYAVNGYSFCNLFKFNSDIKYWVQSGGYWNKTYPIYRRGKNKGCMKLSFKCDKYFRGSQVIFVDVDYTHFTSVEDYINSLTLEPTCVYMSYSDNKDKHGITSRRFRMVYVFDKELNKDEFVYVANNLYECIEADTNERMEDNCGKAFSQYMNGVYNNNEVYSTNTIYSVEDFIPQDYVIPVVEDEVEKEEVKVVVDKQFESDLHNLSYRHFIYKYKDYQYFYRSTPTEYIDGIYQFTSTDYVELFYNKEKVLDGNKRRKKLYDRAALRRIMKPTASIEEIIYNLYIDVYKYFDNSDDILDVDLIVAKAKRVFTYSVDELKVKYNNVIDYYKDNKPSFIINPAIPNKKKIVGKVRKHITDEKIGELYDVSKSVDENIVILASNGLKIGKSRIYQFLKENGLKQPKKEIIYNPELSIRENMKINGCTKYQIEKAKKEYDATITSTIDYTELDKYYKELDKYYKELDGESASAFFRFYSDYESLDSDIKEIALNKFNITDEQFKDYYLQYQPYVGVNSYYR